MHLNADELRKLPSPMDKISRPVPGSNVVLTNRFFQACFEPDDEGAGGSGEPVFDFAAPTEALSLDKGAQILGDALAEKPENRDPATGRFKGAEKADVEEDTKVVDLKTGKPPEKAAQEPASDDEDDDPEIEFPAEEEGKDPTRRKLSDVLAGFEKAATLEKEVEELRTRTSQMPVEVTTAVQQAVEERGRYLQSLEYVTKLFAPVPPDSNLANPDHPNYDPNAYWAAQQAFERNKEAVAKIRGEIEAEGKKQAENQRALATAYLAREQAALYQAWPEARSPETAQKVSADLKQVYGFGDDEIKNTTDHRMWLVVRDALELRALKAKQAEAVKVVRGKPKLVKGAARTSTDSKAAGRSQAMAKLSQTGSIHDAVQAVKGLI